MSVGYMKHDAIIVTTWKASALAEAAERAKALGLYVLGPSPEVTNGYATMVVCPDGSKEGWDESDAFDRRRAEFIAYLNSCRYEDNSTCLDWVAVAYSGDSRKAAVEAHAWEVPLTVD